MLRYRHQLRIRTIRKINCTLQNARVENPLKNLRGGLRGAARGWHLKVCSKLGLGAKPATPCEDRQPPQNQLHLRRKHLQKKLLKIFAVPFQKGTTFCSAMQYAVCRCAVQRSAMQCNAAIANVYYNPKGMANNMKRTIKISEEAYQTLSHQSDKEKKPMEEIATAIISATLATATPNSHGEQYDPKTGKRIFSR